MDEKVSIYVIAYNHAPWIEKSIRSIVEQKTSFNFKLYIHDDASTDGTTEIIRRLSNEYPERIVPLYEEENQYSKGISIVKTFLFPKLHGKYIAFCEGDDYWFDQEKLQKQVDYMESHPECTLCFSNAVTIDTNGRVIKPFFSERSWNDKMINKKLKAADGADFTVEEMILLDFTPTASHLYRIEAIDEIKKFRHSLDLLTRLVTTNMGYAHYHNEIFTAYRIGNVNSASGSIIKSYEKLKKSFLDLHTKILQDFDDYTSFQFTDVIHHEIKRKEIELYFNAGKEYYKKIKEHECYNELTMKKKMKIFAKLYFSDFVRFYKKTKYKNDVLAEM